MSKQIGFLGGMSSGLFFGAIVGDFLLGGMTGLVIAIAMQSTVPVAHCH